MSVRLPSPQYIRNQVVHLANAAVSRVQNAIDRVRATLNSLENTYRAVSYGLRQEVPFERWFFDHGFQQPINDTQPAMKARAYALLATFEGSIRTTAEAISYVFALAVAPKEAPRHLDVLKAQWQGLTLSLLAILSPNQAKEKAHNAAGGQPLIGASLLNWRWGTLYNGTRHAPFWHIECRHYPWADRP